MSETPRPLSWSAYRKIFLRSQAHRPLPVSTSRLGTDRMQLALGLDVQETGIPVTSVRIYPDRDHVIFSYGAIQSMLKVMPSLGHTEIDGLTHQLYFLYTKYGCLFSYKLLDQIRDDRDFRYTFMNRSKLIFGAARSGFSEASLDMINNILHPGIRVDTLSVDRSLMGSLKHAGRWVVKEPVQSQDSNLEFYNVIMLEHEKPGDEVFVHKLEWLGH